MIRASNRSSGSPLTLRDISPINSALTNSSLLEMQSSGLLFTWNNKSRSKTRTMSRIDHAFLNFLALSSWPNILNYVFPHSSLTAAQLRSIQIQMLNQPSNTQLFDKEHELSELLNKALTTECEMKRHKLRNSWHINGDENIKFFHATLKPNKLKLTFFKLRALKAKLVGIKRYWACFSGLLHQSLRQLFTAQKPSIRSQFSLFSLVKFSRYWLFNISSLWWRN